MVSKNVRDGKEYLPLSSFARSTCMRLFGICCITRPSHKCKNPLVNILTRNDFWTLCLKVFILFRMRTKEGQTILAFRGLPYAKPPVGNGRWEKWTHTIFLSLIHIIYIYKYIVYILSPFPSILLARCLSFFSLATFSLLYFTVLHWTLLYCVVLYRFRRSEPYGAWQGIWSGRKESKKCLQPNLLRPESRLLRWKRTCP